MIWSSLARNRSPSFVALRFFGRIVPSDGRTESRPLIQGNPQTKTQASAPSDPQSLQSQRGKSGENRLSLNGLDRSSRPTSYSAHAHEDGYPAGPFHLAREC